jgi:hypothetical protein
MKSLLIALFCVFLINSCGEETNPYEYKTCDLSNIIVFDATGTLYKIGANATNDWFTYYNGTRVAESIFNQTLYPNPVSKNTAFNTSLNVNIFKDSKVKIFLNDSIMIDDFFQGGSYTFRFDFSNKADGCYKLRAECYYGATKSNNKSDTILTSSGTMLLDKVDKFKDAFKL